MSHRNHGKHRKLLASLVNGLAETNGCIIVCLCSFLHPRCLPSPRQTETSFDGLCSPLQSALKSRCKSAKSLGMLQYSVQRKPTHHVLLQGKVEAPLQPIPVAPFMGSSSNGILTKITFIKSNNRFSIPTIYNLFRTFKEHSTQLERLIYITHYGIYTLHSPLPIAIGSHSNFCILFIISIPQRLPATSISC